MRFCRSGPGYSSARFRPVRRRSSARVTLSLPPILAVIVPALRSHTIRSCCQRELDLSCSARRFKIAMPCRQASSASWSLPYATRTLPR